MIAASTAVAAPAIALRCARTLNPANNPNKTIIGNAATRVESHQCPRGSYTCVQVTEEPLSGFHLNFSRSQFPVRRLLFLFFGKSHDPRVHVVICACHGNRS